MTSGLRSIALGLSLLLAAAPSGAAAAAGADRVAALLAILDPAPVGAFPFVEKRMSSLLAAPIELRGELLLGPDGTIDKRVFEPTAERVRVSARVLTIERDGKTRTIDLAGNRQWRTFHAGISGLLNHDMAALSRVFAVTLSESPDGWTLELRPRVEGGEGMITMISAYGRGSRLLRLRFEQGAGEWQEMEFPQVGG